jgi:hypothetical protein
MTGVRILWAVLFAFLGAGFALAQLWSLHGIVEGLVGAGPRTRAILLHLARMGLIATAWSGVAWLGGAPGLIAAFVGFLAARPVVMARIRRASP